MQKKVIKLPISCQEDRNELICILAKSGYKVWIETLENRILEKSYLVCFEIEEENAKNKVCLLIEFFALSI